MADAVPTLALRDLQAPMTHEEAISLGVRDAWDFWLSQHDISVPECIEAAVREAVSDWLDSHTADLLDRMAQPPDISGTTEGRGDRWR